MGGITLWDFSYPKEIKVCFFETKLNHNEILARLEEMRREEKSKDKAIQVFDAENVCGEEHLYHSTRLDVKSFKRGGISRSLEIEILLFVAGERQISRALEKVGVKEGTKRVAVVLVNSSEEDVKWIGERTKPSCNQERIKRIFGIKGRDALIEILERSALLPII